MPNPRVVVTGGGSGVEGKIEFVNDDIETLQKKVAEKLGYKLVDH